MKKFHKKVKFKMAEIVLTADQEENVRRTNEIANLHPLILETSPTGSGKTIMVIDFIRKRNIKHVIIVCNNSVQADHWESHRLKYNLNVLLIITYDSLRGSKTVLTPEGKRMVSNRLLYKVGDDMFEPTEYFMLLVEQGLCLIADECHSIKNDRAKTAAFKALSRYITMRSRTQPYPANRSWSYYLSMTPFDKPEHCVNFLFTCGIVFSQELYSKINDRATGILELFEYCKYFNPQKTNSIWALYDVKSNNAVEVAYKLTVDVFLRLISTFTKNSQIGYRSKQSIYYAYFDVPNEGHLMMKRALEMINSPVKNSNFDLKVNPSVLSLSPDLVNPSISHDVVNRKSDSNINNSSTVDDLNFDNLTLNSSCNDSNINPLQNDINSNINQQTGQYFHHMTEEQIIKYKQNEEIAKLFNYISMGENINDRHGVIHGTITCHTVKTYFILCGFIHHLFQTIPNVKIIVFLDYKESINIITRFLQCYNPAKITGDSECTKERRREIINKFNEPNNELRLLTIISQIGSDSIELDDKHGNFPRVGLGFPDFYYSRFFQCPGRIQRRFTESNNMFFWCLVNTNEYSEESVLKSTNEKSTVMEETLQNNEIIPPIYYQKIVNPHTHDLNKLLEDAGKFEVNRSDKKPQQQQTITKVSQVTFKKRF